MNWLLDFDDTLALGPITWALTHVIPRMVRENHLPFDEARFPQVVLKAQEASNAANADEAEVVNYVFGSMGWPEHLKQWLVNEIYSGYQVALFEDTIPFLERLKASGQPVFLMSNNNHAPDMLHYLGIAGYFNALYTPKLCGGVRAKPSREMWDYVLSQNILDGGQVTIVGDDPWADGAFADDCRIDCWILDRMGRYESLYATMPYRFARSLSDIR